MGESIFLFTVKRLLTCLFTGILVLGAVAPVFAQSLQEVTTRVRPVWVVAINDQGAGHDPTQTFTTAELACQASISQTAQFRAENGHTDLPTYVSTDPIRYHHAWNVGSNGEGYARSCNDHTYQDFALPQCQEGNVAIPYGIDAECVAETKPGECNPCEEGDTPLAQPPLPLIGNPISIESGAKVQTEDDYAAADRLLRVRRSYRSLQRDRLSAQFNAEIPSFGPNWHGLLPGELIASGTAMEQLTFLSVKGTATQFTASAGDTSSWTYSSVDSTRLQVAPVSASGIDRVAYLRDGAAPTNGVAEFRLSYANGDYVLFRRADSFDNSNVIRRLVPVEQGFANGYKLFFDYPDIGQFPSQLHDSFGRTLALTWTDVAWCPSSEHLAQIAA